MGSWIARDAGSTNLARLARKLSGRNKAKAPISGDNGAFKGSDPSLARDTAVVFSYGAKEARMSSKASNLITD